MFFWKYEKLQVDSINGIKYSEKVLAFKISNFELVVINPS